MTTDSVGMRTETMNHIEYNIHSALCMYVASHREFPSVSLLYRSTKGVTLEELEEAIRHLRMGGLVLTHNKGEETYIVPKDLKHRKPIKITGKPFPWEDDAAPEITDAMRCTLEDAMKPQRDEEGAPPKPEQRTWRKIGDTLQCPTCDGDFILEQPRQKYCKRTDCKGARGKKRKKRKSRPEKKKESKGVERICPTCEAAFTTHTNATYCGDYNCYPSVQKKRSKRNKSSKEDRPDENKAVRASQGATKPTEPEVEWEALEMWMERVQLLYDEGAISKERYASLVVRITTLQTGYALITEDT